MNSGVVGYLYESSIIAENIFIEGNIEKESNYMGSLIGDISGENLYANINNVINTMNIKSTYNYAGGIIGDFRGVNEYSLTNIVNLGNVEANTTVSGMFVLNGSIGSGEKRIIKNVTNYGTVRGINSIGGIGIYGSSIVDHANNYGNIYCSSSECHGIVGGISSTISNSNNYGEVHGSYSVSGIAGGGTITNCVNYGDVYGDNPTEGLCSSTSSCTLISSENKGNKYPKDN